jgi:hypothetical protein
MQGGNINCNKIGSSSLRTMKAVKYFTAEYYEISIGNDCDLHSKGRLKPLQKGSPENS